MAALTANAIISKIKWQDNFNRTVGPTNPRASTDWGPDWVVNGGSTGGLTWVDGSALRATANKYAYGELVDQSGPRVEAGFVQFDFYIPANASDSNPYWWATQGGRYPIAVEVYHYSGANFQAGLYYYYSGVDPYYAFSVTPSTWYTVKGVFSGERGGFLGIKVWKVGDPEPTTFGAVGSISELATPLVSPSSWYDLSLELDSPYAEDGRVDNLVYGSYGAPLDALKVGSLTAGAIKSRTMPTRLFVVDAVIAALSFSAGAWIVGGRSGHSRFWDHYGTEPDTVVVLDGPIGPYPSGTTVHVVLSDLVSRITALEAGNHVVQSFTSGAWIQPYLRASAVLFKTMTVHVWNNNLPFPFKADAVLVRGKTDQPITLDAAIIKSPESAVTVNAYLIDLVC